MSEIPSPTAPAETDSTTDTDDAATSEHADVADPARSSEAAEPTEADAPLVDPDATVRMRPLRDEAEAAPPDENVTGDAADDAADADNDDEPEAESRAADSVAEAAHESPAASPDAVAHASPSADDPADEAAARSPEGIAVGEDEGVAAAAENAANVAETSESSPEGDAGSAAAAADEAASNVEANAPSAAASSDVATAKPAVPNDALREELEAAVAALQGEEAPPPRRVKREPPPIPEIPGVPPEQVMKALAAVWKEATDRETPTFKQTLEEGVTRVDVDAVAGYLAVSTESDSHRAIGVRRDMVAPLVAALTARTVRDVEQWLAKGPAKIPTAVKAS